jgi:hypothetical protein
VADDVNDVVLVDSVGNGPNTYCVVPFDPDAGRPDSPCYQVDLDTASLAPLAAKPAAQPDYVKPKAKPLMSPDGKTRVVLPAQWPDPVKSFDVKTGKLLGSPKLDESSADMSVNVALTRFIGDTLFAVYYQDSSMASIGHLFDPRTWKEIKKSDDVLALRDFHVDGSVYAIVSIVCGDGGEVAAPTVKWTDVATGAVQKTIELPWKECMFDPLRMFEKNGRIGIVSRGAMGNVAIVDLKARTLVKSFSLGPCTPSEK